MDSSVKQLQQVIPLKIQTMEIKFAPLQTAHLSRTFKLLPRLGHFPAVVSLPLENHFAFRVIEHMEEWKKLCKCATKRHVAKKKKKNLKYLRNAEVETIRVDLLNVC